jgi:hypothetical protein
MSTKRDKGLSNSAQCHESWDPRWYPVGNYRRTVVTLTVVTSRGIAKNDVQPTAPGVGLGENRR